MGFFSFNTNDTNISIPNRHQSRVETFPVYLHDNQGNVWPEFNYDGYGMFGGIDYYWLLADMNDLCSEDDDFETKRSAGIDAYFKGNNEILYFPQITQSERLPKNTNWHQKPYSCEYQGHFYP